MASTTISSTGFYAIVDFSLPSPTITQIGYRPGITIWIPSIFGGAPDAFGRMVVQPSPAEIWNGGNPANGEIRKPFEAFLRTLYGAQCELTGAEPLLGLYEQMRDNGVLSQCSEVEVVDFMAFCGAIEQFQVLPDGTQKDCLSLGPGDERPLVADLRRKSDSLMWGIVEFLGLWGMLPFLYIRGGITFEKFVEKLKIWQPDPADRLEYYVYVLRPILRANNNPVLEKEQINMILS